MSPNIVDRVIIRFHQFYSILKFLTFLLVFIVTTWTKTISNILISVATMVQWREHTINVFISIGSSILRFLEHFNVFYFVSLITAAVFLNSHSVCRSYKYCLLLLMCSFINLKAFWNFHVVLKILIPNIFMFCRF